MTLANCPAECEHCAPCLAELYEAADDMMDYSATLPPIRHQPVLRDTKEETE
jgi:hypothetical protein